MAIKTLDEFLATIPDDDNRERMVDVVVWVGLTYPELKLRRACSIVCVSVFCLKGLMHDE